MHIEQKRQQETPLQEIVTVDLNTELHGPTDEMPYAMWFRVGPENPEDLEKVSCEFAHLKGRLVPVKNPVFVNSQGDVHYIPAKPITYMTFCQGAISLKVEDVSKNNSHSGFATTVRGLGSSIEFKLHGKPPLRSFVGMMREEWVVNPQDPNKIHELRVVFIDNRPRLPRRD